MRTPLLTISLVVFSWPVSYSQTVTIKQVKLAGEKVIVVYDLDDSDPNNAYLLLPGADRSL